MSPKLKPTGEAMTILYRAEACPKPQPQLGYSLPISVGLAIVLAYCEYLRQVFLSSLRVFVG